MGLFQFVDVSKDFFFSYTYDISHSLQYNYSLLKNSGRHPEDKLKVCYVHIILTYECISDIYYVFLIFTHTLIFN